MIARLHRLHSNEEERSEILYLLIGLRLRYSVAATARDRQGPRGRPEKVLRSSLRKECQKGTSQTRLKPTRSPKEDRDLETTRGQGEGSERQTLKASNWDFEIIDRQHDP